MRNLIAAVFGLTLVAGAAFAASPTAPVFYQIDTNSDGVLTRAELVGAGVFHLSLRGADMDNNGTLSKSEYAAAISPHGRTDAGKVAETY